MTERFIQSNRIEIWTEDFGEAGHPPILLIAGATAQGLMWRTAFCQQLADHNRYIIRYDHRDTGLSTCFDFAETPYTFADLADDAVGVLDAYNIAKAHIVGLSMGGMIGQTIAIEHPDRICSLVSICSSPGQNNKDAESTGFAPLPSPTSKYIALINDWRRSPPQTRQEHIDLRVRVFRTLAGSLVPFDEAGERQFCEQEYDRALNYVARTNHGLAAGASPDRRAALMKVATPTLVIHGTEDPVLPYAHGVATAEVIPNAKLMTIEGLGHELPAAIWPAVIEAIVSHTA